MGAPRRTTLRCSKRAFRSPPYPAPPHQIPQQPFQGIKLDAGVTGAAPRPGCTNLPAGLLTVSCSTKQYRVANSLVLPPLLQVNNLSSPISVVASRPAVAHRLLLPAPAPAALPDHAPRIHVRERFPRPIHVRSCGSPSPCLAAHLYTKPLNVLHPLLLQRGSAVEACRRVQLSCLQPAAAAGAGAGAGAGGPGGARACC